MSNETKMNRKVFVPALGNCNSLVENDLPPAMVKSEPHTGHETKFGDDVQALHYDSDFNDKKDIATDNDDYGGEVYNEEMDDHGDDQDYDGEADEEEQKDDDDVIVTRRGRINRTKTKCSTKSKSIKKPSSNTSKSFSKLLLSYPTIADKDEILRKINEGIYQMSERQGKSTVWTMFADIQKDDGFLLYGYVCCKKCKKVMKHDGKQTSNMRRHKCVKNAAKENEIQGVKQNTTTMHEEVIVPSEELALEHVNRNTSVEIETPQDMPKREPDIDTESNDDHALHYVGDSDNTKDTLIDIDGYDVEVYNEAMDDYGDDEDYNVEADEDENKDDVTLTKREKINRTKTKYNSKSKSGLRPRNTRRHQSAKSHSIQPRSFSNLFLSCPTTADKEEILRKISEGVYQMSERQGKSTVWTMFTDIKKEDGTLLDGYVCCKICKKMMKYDGRQTSNMRRHKCVTDAVNQNKIRRVTQEDKEAAISACSQWIVEDCRPFSVVEGTGFAKLAQFFINIGARYGRNVDIHDLIPDASTVSRKIHKMATEKKSEIKQIIKKVVDEGRASVTTDLWTDNYVKRNFLCCTIHYFDNDNLTSIVLGVKSMDFERSTGLNIHNKLLSLFSQFGIHNLKRLTFVTDRESNINNALQAYTRINCSNQLFSNVVNSAFDSTDDLKSLICTCEQLVKYLKKSNKQHALQISLKTHCTTRWKSLYIMFKSIADNWLSISEILTNNDQNRFCDINIDIVNRLVDLCQYFDTLSNTLQGCSYHTICFVLPSIYRLREVCEAIHSDVPAIINFKRKILQYIENTWIVNLSFHHKVALFLYPPAKYMNEPELKIIKQFCVDNITANNENDITLLSASHTNLSLHSSRQTLAPITSPSNKFKLFLPNVLREMPSESVVQEVDRYCTHRIINENDFDTIKWWKEQNTVLPRLSKFALNLLSIPASSAASERVFSLAGNLINEKRNRLAPKSVDNILFLNSLLKIENK